MAAELSAIVVRLESVTSRLEGLASGGGSVDASGDAGGKIWIGCERYYKQTCVDFRKCDCI